MLAHQYLVLLFFVKVRQVFHLHLHHLLVSLGRSTGNNYGY
jgi:hypothetical protein